MPITKTIYDPPGVVLVSVAGVLRPELQLEYLQWMATAPQMRPGLCEIIDLRGITDFLVSNSQEAGFAYAFKVHEQIQRNLTASVLLVGDELTYGMARVYQQAGRTPTVDIAVCTSVDEALRRLHLPPDFAATIDRAHHALLADTADSATLPPGAEPRAPDA